MGWWSDIWTKKAQSWVYGKVDTAQTPGDTEEKTLGANEEYLQIYLKSMWIVDVRKGLNKFYAAVHSFISVAHRSGEDAQFNVLTTPNKLKELDSARIDNVVNINKQLLGPIPYRGGKLEMEVGLFSIKSTDLAQPYLSLLTDLSSVAGVSFISQALPFVNPIKNGINMLAGGSDDSILEIGLSSTYPTVQTGYYIVIRAPKSKYKLEDFKIGKDYKLLYKDGKEVTEYPYMVLQIFSTKNRDDYFKIPEIQKAYKKLQDEVQGGNTDNVSEALLVLKRMLLTSNDLIFKDGKKIYETVANEIEEILPSAKEAHGMTESYRGASVVQLKDLESLNISFAD